LTVFRNTNLDSSDYTSLAELVVDTAFTKGQVLFQEGSETNATLYFVRDGEVQLTSASKSDESHNKVINQGGVFGEDMLQRDAHQNANAISLDSAECIAHYTATVSEDCTLGILTLEECRTVFDTTQMGKARPFQSIKGSQITMESLKRHKILGAGTFGQVWLVSRLASDGKTRKAYALKIQSKYELVRNSQARGVVQEKNIMAKLHHPFIIKLVTTYQDTQRVYMLMGLVQGGELFGLMNKAKGNILSEHDTKFYSAGILEGLGHMHRRHILYRDLKPENVLLDDAGYPVIVDLGFGTYGRF
jgi:Protein kinase domain/Cyclic nucleotide-binding domain